MEVIFIKDHPSGVKEGTKTRVRELIAQMWIAQGYVKKYTKPKTKKKVEPKQDKLL